MVLELQLPRTRCKQAKPLSLSVPSLSVVNCGYPKIQMKLTISVGSIALFIGIVFLIRRIMRKRRIGKAESPPSSPLLTPIDSPMPLSIARSMSQRSGGNDFWGFSNGNTIAGPRGEKADDSYRGVAPLSPLPQAATSYGGSNNTNNTNDFAGFKLFPSPSKGDGKAQTPRDF